MRPDLLILDCDGVLVDTEPISNRAVYGLLVQKGVTLSPEAVHELLIGHTSRASVGILAPYLAPGSTRNLEEEINEVETAAMASGVEPLPGVVDLLKACPIPYCVASNGALSKMRASLAAAGLLSFFEGKIFSAESVDHGKPAPDLFCLAAQTMDVKPERCWVIEDSMAGLRAAKAAEMTAFGVIGHLSEEEIKKIGAEPIDRVDQILPRLQS
ncbi:MAG: HAD family hydrolase [Armatimonadetes bacterium]|nr:HAD family hydrolase [Armatimonadota bacterium]